MMMVMSNRRNLLAKKKKPKKRICRLCEFFFKGGAVVAQIQKCSASLKHQVKVVNYVLSKTTFQANEHAV